MAMQLIDKLKRQFEPNKLFLFSEIKEKGLTEAALKEELLAFTKKAWLNALDMGSIICQIPRKRSANGPRSDYACVI
jgi:hypothetical protein